MRLDTQLEKDLDKKLRDSETCEGCGSRKDKGTVVCWDCFKYRTDVTPLKYFQGSLTGWFKYINQV